MCICRQNCTCWHVWIITGYTWVCPVTISYGKIWSTHRVQPNRTSYTVWEVYLCCVTSTRRAKHEENIVRDPWGVSHGQLRWTFIVVYLALTLLKLDAYTRISLFHWEMAVRAMKSTASYLFLLSSKTHINTHSIIIYYYSHCTEIAIIIVTWYVLNNRLTILEPACHMLCRYPASKWFSKYYLHACVWPSALPTWIYPWLELLQA